MISSIRYAPDQIPLALGNLRQEIEAERWALRQRCKEGDSFQVFKVSGRMRKRKRGLQAEVMHLLMRTVDKLWMDFLELERPFLIKSGTRAEAVQRGDYWGEKDIDADNEKAPGTSRKGNRGGNAKRMSAMGMEEANVGFDERYYRTDLSHRIIWWQSKGNVDRLAQQVQRVQIRRIERDTYEMDELVKRILRKMDGGGDGGGSGSGSESDDGGPKGSGGINRRGSGRSVRGGGTTYESKETEFVRVPARSRAGSVRPDSRAGSVSRVASPSPPRRRSPRLRERNAERTASPVEQRPSNTARRRAARESRPSDSLGHEYEVVRPGRDGTYTININSPRRTRPGLRESQDQSYYRERSVPRGQGRSSMGYDDD